MNDASDKKQWEWIKSLDDCEARLVLKDLLEICIFNCAIKFKQDARNVEPYWASNWAHLEGDPLVPGVETWVEEGKD